MNCLPYGVATWLRDDCWSRAGVLVRMVAPYSRPDRATGSDLMRHLLTALSLLSIPLTPQLAAQSCPDSVLGTALGVGDEVTFPIQPIGFPFPFAGTTYSNVHICSNGYLLLSNAGVPAPSATDYTSTTTEFVAGSPRIAPLWNDLDIRADNAGQCYVNSTPAKCTITWKNAQNYNAGLGGGTKFDIQVQLSPGGEVRFYYSSNVTNNSSIALGQPAIVGVTPGGGAVLPAATDFAAAGASPGDTVFEVFQTPNTFDLPGYELLLVPTVPGYVNVVSTPSNCAGALDYGVGCVEQRDSFYENFATAAAFDLGGRTISMLRQGSGYVVLDSIPGSIVAPSPGAQIVANADDTTQNVTLSAPMPVAGGTTSQLVVNSNGTVTLSSVGNGNDWSPTAAELLAWASTGIAVSWHDYNPIAVGSGKIYFEEIGGFAYITWNNVYSYNTTSPHRFQVQCNVATGDITLVYGAWIASGGAHVVGYSVGGPSADKGGIDLSTVLASPLFPSDTQSQGVKLTTGSLPFLGNAAFTWEASSVPTLAPVAWLLVGDTIINPGLDLTGFGFTSCNLYSNLNLLSVQFPLTPSGTGSIAQPVPNLPIYAGLQLFSQVVALSTLTPAGFVVSNGNAVQVGY